MAVAPEILSAMTTPFVGGRVDLGVLEAQLRHVAPYSDGVFLPGTTGEFVALDDDEFTGILTTAVNVLGADRVVAHVGAAGLEQSRRRLDIALDRGIIRCSALTPFYFRVRAETVLDYYAQLATHAGERTELYAYVFPEVTGNDLGPEYVSALVDAGIKGVKTSGAASVRVAEYARSAPHGFGVWSGNDADLPHILESGGRGTVSGVSGVVPHLWARFRDAWAADDEAGWRGAQDDIARVVALVGPTVARHKFAAACAGLPASDVRMSMDPVPVEVQERIRVLIDELSFDERHPDASPS